MLVEGSGYCLTAKAAKVAKEFVKTSALLTLFAVRLDSSRGAAEVL
jgi:hypothetical protein